MSFFYEKHGVELRPDEFAVPIWDDGNLYHIWVLKPDEVTTLMTAGLVSRNPNGTYSAEVDGPRGHRQFERLLGRNGL